MANTSVPALRLAVLPILVVGIVFLETQPPFSGFRLVSFVLLFILFAEVTSMMHGRLRDLLLVVTSLVFGLTVIAAASGIILSSPLLTVTPGFEANVPVMGWGPTHAGHFRAKKSDPRTGQIIYDVSYTIGPDLLRETQSCRNCTPTIAFFGDSFTFGEGLNDPDTLPQLFANGVDPKIRVLNLGFSGYGPQQFLREMETGRFDKVIGPKPRLFVFLTAPWHAERTSCKAFWVKNGPRYILENGNAVYKGLCSQGPPLRLREWMDTVHTPAPIRAVLEPFLEKPDHADIDLYIRILVAATRLAKEKYGVPMLIPFMSASAAYLFGTGFTNAEIMQRLKDGGAFVVDVSLEHEKAAGATLKILGDGHPTPLANRLRATILKDYVAQHLATVLAANSGQENSAPAASHK